MKVKDVEFELRDLLIAVPALGVVIAVTWEVGKFTAFGGFNLFSLSEHVLTSLQALPLALIIAMATTVMAASKMGVTSGGHLADSSKTPPRGLKRFLGILAIFGLVALMIVAGIFVHLAMFVALGVLLFAISAMAIVEATNPTFYLAVSVAGLLVITMATGNDFARLEMKIASQTSPELLETMETKSGDLRGHVLMSGDRGILFYEPAKDEISFVRSDEIKSLKRKRTGILSLWSL